MLVRAAGQLKTQSSAFVSPFCWSQWSTSVDRASQVTTSPSASRPRKPQWNLLAQRVLVQPRVEIRAGVWTLDQLSDKDAILFGEPDIHLDPVGAAHVL